MNSPYHERLQAIKEQNERLQGARENRSKPPPIPPMDWLKPSQNPRMVKLRRFEPGRVAGTKKKSEWEQVSLGEGAIVFHCKQTSKENSISSKSESSILLPPGFIWISCNRHVTSYLQGSQQPMCGLAASLMAGEIMNSPDFDELELDDFLDVAIDNGFTKQGEMFMAEELAQLAEEMLDCESKVLRGSINEHFVEILSHLMEGHPWVIPHDADHDHRPTCRNGEKSHWGLVTGFIVGLDGNSNQKGLKKSGSTRVRNYFLIDDFRKTSQSLRNQILALDPLNSPIFLFAKQGRAPGLKVWSWQDLAESNAQLFEFDTSRFPGDYQIPEGGVRHGLNLKSVLLRPK